MKVIRAFIKDSFLAVTAGSVKYHVWMGFLTLLMLTGGYAYSIQLREGLVVTGMSDAVSWGLYISNFTFFVGVAAAAVMLVLPTYVLHDVDTKGAVLIGEGLAVAALVMCLAFVVADMGGPAVLWHMIPIIGVFNWPQSMLAWDVIVLNVYLFINATIPLYILFSHYQGKEPDRRVYIPGVFLSVFWAFLLHLVTAFLYSGLSSRTFWNTALLGPRFLASAFAAGPALMILILSAIHAFSDYNVGKAIFGKLALIVTVASQVNIIMLVSELFTEFYTPTHHNQSATYLFFGLDGFNALRPWIWTAIALSVVATLILTINPLRRNPTLLRLACVMLFVGIWVEKGFGLIIPGFIPGQWGKITEYTPTWIEVLVTVGIWGLGAFIFTLLVKVALPIELGYRRYQSKATTMLPVAGD